MAQSQVHQSVQVPPASFCHQYLFHFFQSSLERWGSANILAPSGLKRTNGEKAGTKTEVGAETVPAALQGAQTSQFPRFRPWDLLQTLPTEFFSLVCFKERRLPFSTLTLAKQWFKLESKGTEILPIQKLFPVSTQTCPSPLKGSSPIVVTFKVR